MKHEESFALGDDEMPIAPPPGPRRRQPKPKDAATLVLIRNGREVMLGQRAKGHVFMPDKWVFPGGRVDRGDARAKAASELTAETEALLRRGKVSRPPRAFALAATRETCEETGLRVGGPEGPDLAKLSFIARAITPPNRSRRFDARFFMADAAEVLCDDCPVAGEELLHTEWFPFQEAEKLDLPSITRFVLKEAQARLDGAPIDPPFLYAVRGQRRMQRLSLADLG